MIRSDERGYILAAVVVVTGVLLVAGATTLKLVRSQLHANADQLGHQKAFYIAEAGIQRGIAQLDADRALASTSTSYTFSATEPFAEGTYTVFVDQDPLFPAMPTRKRIRSSGRVGSQTSETLAHVVVQDQLPCAIAASQTDTRILSLVPAATELFDGLLYANRDAVFHVLGGAAIDGEGSVFAGRNLVSNSLVSLLSTLRANAFRGGGYSALGLHADALGVPVLGVHFNNGNGKHGVQQAVAPRAHPIPDYDGLAKDPLTRIVNDDNPPPFGTWDPATDTWSYGSLVAFPSSPEIVYYVDGNVNFGSLALAANARATIVARGWISILSVGLVASSLGGGTTVAVGPVGAGAPIVLPVGSNSEQHLELLATDLVSIGRPVLSTSPTISFDSETAALADATLGIGLSAAAIGSTRTYVYAYSETGSVWAKMASVAVGSGARATLLGNGETALAYGGSLASAVRCPF
jgi:hypothetical protein